MLVIASKGWFIGKVTSQPRNIIVNRDDLLEKYVYITSQPSNIIFNMQYLGIAALHKKIRSLCDRDEWLAFMIYNSYFPLQWNYHESTNLESVRLCRLSRNFISSTFLSNVYGLKSLSTLWFGALNLNLGALNLNLNFSLNNL